MDRYFLFAELGGETVEREVTLLEYVRAERAAGFRGGGENRPSTAAWSVGSLGGRVEYHWEGKEE